MSDRNKTHNGRDVDGHLRVRKADVDDLVADPDGAAHLRDDIRLGGAVEDTGPQAGSRGAHIGDLVKENRDNVKRSTKS
ncbi:MAG: hypothetical protein ABJE10_13725 [bacterium]